MGSTEAVRQSVKAGIGISILSRRAVADDIKWGALFPVDVKDVRFNRPFYLVRRKNRNLSPVGAAFLNHLKA
jgi:DNA-binding transcriptional LysR family regulator